MDTDKFFTKVEEKRFIESWKEKFAGSLGEWIPDTTIFTLASVSEKIFVTKDSGNGGDTVGNIWEKIRVEDIATRVDEQIVYAAVKAIGMDVPLPVKVNACQALSQLLNDTNSGVDWPHIKHLISSVIKHTMNGIFEILRATFRADHFTSQEALEVGSLLWDLLATPKFVFNVVFLLKERNNLHLDHNIVVSRYISLAFTIVLLFTLYTLLGCV
ncbi:unnamed protein product [Cuscuta europaea]|uniref:Uncharacterized protein n=1 Tax=Cuscuta europaea TaxID=41803 RepID=A0A9P1EHF8_CUSEU|nr:unnamed protein product [Cuscuta europaea]